jgi:hypothetical protein
MEINNIGRGVAKDLEYFFYYDLDECVNVLKEFNVDKYLVINTTSGMTRLEFGQVNLEPISFSHPIECAISRKDFQLPIDKTSSSIQIYLPQLYIYLNFIKDFLQSVYRSTNPKSERTIDDEFPKLGFECKYLDMGLRKISKSFDFNFYYDIFSQLISPSNRFYNKTYTYNVTPIDVTNILSGDKLIETIKEKYKKKLW